MSTDESATTDLAPATPLSARLGGVPDQPPLDLAQAFAVAPASLSITDVHGRIIAANDCFWSLFGWEPDDGLDVGMLSRPEDQDWTRSYLTRLVTGDEDEFRSFKRFVRRDGSEFDGRLSVHPIRRDGRCVGLIGHIEPTEVRPIVDDVRLRKILQHDAGTITLIDADGAVIETAGRYRATLGYPPEFWEDRTIIDILVPDDLERVLQLRDDLVAEPGHVVKGDFRVVAADRRVEVLEATAVNLLDDPDVGGIVISTRNVTEERADSATLSQLRDEAVAEAERRSHLMAVVSHELRNPLHAMSGLAELLASDDALAADHRGLAATLHRQLLHLSAVTDDLLEASRIDTGQFELRTGSVLIRDLIDDVISVGKAAADGRITVDVIVEPDVPTTVVTDPARLQQIITNLVDNAVKFTDRGRVDVSVSWKPGDELVIVVTDTGPGIPDLEQDVIFGAFATATTSGDRRGAGLGLAIVKRLVEALGGSISVSSVVETGSRFTVTLPCEGATGSEASSIEPAAHTAAGRRRILVVEDTPVNQVLARHQLARIGMDAHVVGSAEEALDALERNEYDAVLMDHQLPGMNGRDATREIRASGSVIPIVGITASSTAADEQACLEAGMDAFLAKPAGLEQVRAALAHVIDRATAPPPAPASDTAHRAAIDTAVLDALAGELGDRELVVMLVQTFLDELDGRRVDIAGEDASLAARQAHTLKSSARLLGANALADACEAAERDSAARGRIATIATEAEQGLRAWVNVAGDTTADEVDTDRVTRRQP